MGMMSEPTVSRPMLSIDAHAKVNLTLAVGAPIEDGEHEGMHPICSWMASVGLCDTLELTRLEEDSLSRFAIVWAEDAPQPNDGLNWSITSDLAVRAHQALEAHLGATLPVQMRLLKRIPVGAGMGGGSSDAAAMLLGLRELFELTIDDQALREIAKGLGSDVPFFLGNAPRSAIVSGLGGEIEPIRHEPVDLVLILPECACPTGRVYGALDHLRTGMSIEFRDSDARRLAAFNAADLNGMLFNDLAEAAEAVEPELRGLRERAADLLEQAVHITGSGAAMFTVCAGGAMEAELLAERLGETLEGCACLAVVAG